MDLVWKGIHFSAFQERVEVSPGLVKTFEFIWRIDGTRTIAQNSESLILLTKEYRHELRGYDWRLPGGKLDYKGEAIEAAAARELREETGVRAATWRYLWSTTPDATVRFKRHFLHATNLTMESAEPSDGEDITVAWFAPEDAKAMALSGDIREEISALALLRFLSRLS